MMILKVERIGGLPGFGKANSHLRSTGEINMVDLSEDDRQKIEALFKSPTTIKSTKAPHAFRYRITRTTASGTESVEAGEEKIPDVIRRCVKDEFI